MKNPNTIKPALDDLFAFQIGDLVVLRHQLVAYKLDLEINGKIKRQDPDKFHYTKERVRTYAPDVVLARLVEECHGGVQMHYLLNRVSDEGRQSTNRYTELEIVPWEEAVAVFRTVYYED